MLGILTQSVAGCDIGANVIVPKQSFTLNNIDSAKVFRPTQQALGVIELSIK